MPNGTMRMEPACELPGQSDWRFAGMSPLPDDPRGSTTKVLGRGMPSRGRAGISDRGHLRSERGKHQSAWLVISCSVHICMVTLWG